LNQSREAHHPAWPLHSPQGGQLPAVLAADWPHEGQEQRERGVWPVRESTPEAA
jgi:hypothetical protein